jgi:molybdate transport system substrate-binding protein
MNKSRWKRPDLWSFVILALLFVISACTPSGEAAEDPPLELTVSAASSLQPALLEAGAQFSEKTGTQVVLNFGASGQLAEQISLGAPVDVFISASQGFVDRLIGEGHVDRNSSAMIGHGRIVMWSLFPPEKLPTDLQSMTDPAIQQIVIANPQYAPYGVAGRQVLENAGVWAALEHKLIFAGNVSQALQIAETGNVDIAFIALSLALEDDGSWELIPESSHEPIEIVGAVVSSSQKSSAAFAFLEFLQDPKGQAILARYGITDGEGGR